MARGRFISTDISLDKDVNQIGDPWSILAFTWCIPHLDREGRIHGDPAVLKSIVFPRQPQITVEQMEGYIKQWVDKELVIWYEARGDKWLFFPGFEKHQIGLRKEREPASTIPAPPITDDNNETSGSSQENSRQNDDKSPEENGLSIKLIKEESGEKSPEKPRRTVEDAKRSIQEAMARGAAKHINLQERIEQAFNIRPNWDTKTSRYFFQWLKERPSGEELERFADWWKSDWRGKNGSPPTMNQIMELWPQAFKSQKGMEGFSYA